jgi:hypothetical protein
MKRNQESKTTDNTQLVYINGLIKHSDTVDANDISDGYHTFGQLYDCRLAYNAALFNHWGNRAFENSPRFKVHKSKRH